MNKLKKIVAVIVIFLLIFNAQSQRLIRGGVSFGFEIPLNSKIFSSDFDINQSLNFKVGAMIRMGYTFYGQIGVYYDVNKLQMENLQTNSTSAIELGVLKIPFLFGYVHPIWKNSQLRFYAGLQYDALIRMSKNKINLEKKNFNIHNMNVLGGIGMDVKNISFDISYEKAIKTFSSSSSGKRYADMLCLSIGVII